MVRNVRVDHREEEVRSLKLSQRAVELAVADRLAASEQMEQGGGEGRPLELVQWGRGARATATCWVSVRVILGLEDGGGGPEGRF